MFNGNEDSNFDDEESVYFTSVIRQIYYDSLNKIMDSEKNIYTDTILFYYF